MNWLDAGPVEAIAEGQALSVLGSRSMIAVVRSEGAYFAIEDMCSHDGAELIGGEIDGTEIICPRHGARFCLRTGQALTPPAYDPVRIFPTKVENGRLWVLED